jgi:hypothetical protein
VPNTSRSAITSVAQAHKRAFQLRQTLIDLLQTPGEKDMSWHDLAHDADCIERRLRGALNAMNKVLLENPATYTPPPRPD